MSIATYNGQDAPAPPSWTTVLAACQHITTIASTPALRKDDCRLTGRFVRKLGFVLTALAEENPDQPYSDVDASGLLHHTLCCCTDLVERCRSIGTLEAFLEAATLRSEFKTIASDLKIGLERLETDHLRVPADIADDVATLAGQLGSVEYSVASEQEAAAAEVHRMVLMERVGLAHDQQIAAMLTDVLSQCGLAAADHASLTREQFGLRNRAAEAHAQHDHVHELVLLKVADMLQATLPPPPPTGCSSPTPLASTHPRPPSPRRVEADAAACLPPLPPRPVPAAEACPPERRPSLIRRPSCGSMGVLSPNATAVNAAAEAAAKPAELAACNAVMLRSVSSKSLLSAAAGQGGEGCALLAAAEDADMDASDIPGLVQALHSDNCVVAELAATCLLHAAASGMDWEALEGARMRLIRPLINLLRFRNPLSVKAAAARLLQRLARCQESRKLITESGALILLLRLLKTSYDPAKQAAARAITNVAYGNASVKGELVKAGILDMVNAMLEGLHPVNQEAAALAVANLACSDDGVRVLMEAGTLHRIVHVLRDGNTAGRAAAARALRNIVTHHPPAKAAAVDCGAVPLLLSLLDSTTGAARLTAIAALGGLASKNDRIHACIALEGAVASLVAALEDEHASVVEAAATTLAALCTTSESRHALAAAGGVEALAAALKLRGGGAVQGTEGQLQAARAAAAQAVRVLVSCEMHAIKQAVAASGAVSHLAAMLNGSDGDAAQKAAAGALWNLAYKNEDNRNVIRTAGAIPPLVRLLKSYQPEGMRREAARAISNLSCNNHANQVAIAASGAIPPLVHLLQSGSTCSVEAAARALSNLALQDENQADIAAAGAVPALLQLIASGPEACQEAAVRAYGNVIVNNHHAAVATTAPRAIPLLKEMLSREGKRTLQLEAARALGNLACLGSTVQADIVASGVVGTLIKMLDSGHEATRESAACTLWDISYDNDLARRAVVAGNGVPYLVQALLFGCAGTKEAAASTLMELACLGQRTSAPPSAESSPRELLSPSNRASRQATTQVGRGSDDGTSVASVAGEAGGGSVQSEQHSRTASECGVTGAEVRAAIIEAGAMPLLIQMVGSGDAKLQAVGSRALEVMGYSSSSEEVQRGAFPRVSAYHQPALMQPQLLAARF